MGRYRTGAAQRKFGDSESGPLSETARQLRERGLAPKTNGYDPLISEIQRSFKAAIDDNEH